MLSDESFSWQATEAEHKEGPIRLIHVRLMRFARSSSSKTVADIVLCLVDVSRSPWRSVPDAAVHADRAEQDAN